MMRVFSTLVVFLLMGVFASTTTLATSTSVGETRLVGIDDLSDNPSGGIPEDTIPDDDPDPEQDDPAGDLTLYTDTPGTLFLDTKQGHLTYRRPQLQRGEERQHFVAGSASDRVEQIRSSPRPQKVAYDEIIIDDDRETISFVVQQVGQIKDEKTGLMRLIDLENVGSDRVYLSHADYTVGPTVSGEDFVLETRVRNLGTVAESVTVNASLYHAFGKKVVTKPIQFDLAPDEAIELAIPLDAIPWYKFGFTVQLDVSAAPSDYEIEVDSPDALRTQYVSHSGYFFLFPWWLVIVIVGLLILLRVLWYLSRRSRHQNKE